MRADRIGRRPVVSGTVLFYTLFTLFTALSRGLASFTIFQSLAQIFLSAEFRVAIIMVSEEFPDNACADAASPTLQTVGLFGVVAGGQLYGIVADSRWGWRGMYFIGVLPLLLVAFLRRGIRETLPLRSASGCPRDAARALPARSRRLSPSLEPIRGPVSRPAAAGRALWNCVGMVGAPAVTFFALYAKRDHHWSPPQVGHAVVLAYVIGALGNFLRRMDAGSIGRKPTTAISYVVAAVAILASFRARVTARC